MRDWKKTEIPYVRIYRYFQAHQTKFLSMEHIAAQVGIGRQRTRAIILALERAGKVESVELVEALKWGRTRRIWRSLGPGTYPLSQREIFAVEPDPVMIVDREIPTRRKLAKTIWQGPA